MLQFLRDLDQFGVTFQPRIHQSREQHKTHCGGIMSILLYGFCFTYFVYIFFQWQTGSILPQITSQQVVKGNNQLTLKETYLQLQLKQYGHSLIDPFNPQAIILQPVQYIFVNGNHNDTPEQVPYTIESTSDGKFNVLSISNISIAISQDNENPEIEYLLGFSDCQSSLLKDGESCANETTIRDFYAQHTNTMIVKQFIKQYSTSTQSMQIIPKESLIPIQQNYTYYVRTYAQTAFTQVDLGFLFESWMYYEHIIDYRHISSIFDYSFFEDLASHNFPLAFCYSIDSVQLKSTVTFSKLSEVLAQAGSIAQAILVFSYLIVMLNQNNLQFEAINKVISMYYPDFKNIKIRRNILGRINQVEKNGRLIELTSFKETYEKLSKIGEIKLTVSNQIYELSRIQFLLQAIISKQQFKQIHSKGLPLQINYIDAQEDNQSFDLSVAQEFRPSVVVPRNETKVQILEESNQNQRQFDLMLIDNDFNLLAIPDEDFQKNQEINNLQIQQI